MHRLRTALAAVITAVFVAGTLVACSPGGADDGSGPAGESASESGSGSASEEETAQGDGSGDNAGTVEVTIEGDSVEPLGERVEVEVGTELVLHITADAPGSLHVHSTPEQEIHYGKGTTTAAVAVDQPGVIEVESHELGVVVLQLQAS